MFALIPVASDFPDEAREVLADRLGADLATKGLQLRKVRLTRENARKPLEQGARWAVEQGMGEPEDLITAEASGCIAGLGTITPASGFVQPVAAVVIGAAAGVLCYGAVMMKGRLGYDDSLDVVGVHCVGGTLGTLATGLFATTAVNAAGANGLFYGNPKQLAIQALGAGVILVYSFLVSYLLLKVLDRAMGLRVTDENEVMGLDLSQHGEAGYNT